MFLSFIIRNNSLSRFVIVVAFRVAYVFELNVLALISKGDT